MNRAIPRTALADRRFWSRIVVNLVGFPLSVVGIVWVTATLVTGLALSVTVVGLPLAAFSLAGARVIGGWMRRLVRRKLGIEVQEPSPLPAAGGLIPWVRLRLTDTVAWRSELYLFIVFPVGLVGGAVSLAFLLGGLVAVPLLIALPGTAWLFATLHGAFVKALLGPTRSSERIRTLERSRGQVVDDAAAKLRRIERDLHDGAQARIVSLAMNLGMAKERLAANGGDPDDPEARRAHDLITAAHRDAKAALIELRDLARGIHPPALDAGLRTALATLASHSVIPVRLTVDLERRPARAIETIAYYCVAELLTNAAKHSGATALAVDLLGTHDRLIVQVSDDGNGGARIGAGSGLSGLVERVRAVDGDLTVESPIGGPTVASVELPLRT